MKLAPIAALLMLAGLATPVLADGHAETAPAKLSLDTPIEVLLANPAAKAVVFAHLPGIDEHPAYGQFKGMSLVELKPWSQGMITDATLENIAEGLASLG